MKIHEIKLNVGFCNDVISGRRSFEIRSNDRDYETGDLIRFTATDANDMRMDHPINDKLYSIEYVLNGWGLEKGFVAMAIKDVHTDEQIAEILLDLSRKAIEQLFDTHWEECRQIALYDDQLRKAVGLLKRVQGLHMVAEHEGCLAMRTITGRLLQDVDELFEEIKRTETPPEPVRVCPSLSEPVRRCDYTAEPCCYPYESCSLCNEKHGAFARMED